MPSRASSAPSPSTPAPSAPERRVRRLLLSTTRLCKDVADLRFSAPVSHVYNPLEYARAPHARYLRSYGRTRKRVVFLGMNPGPFGMAQTGVPFGEVSIARDWLAVAGPVRRPAREHPKRPVEGFECSRSEVSGQRLWGAIRDHFGTPARFFRSHFVGNYCPLVFMEASGRNRTPDKLPPAERDLLFAACDRHLKRLVDILEPDWVVGIGAFAEKRAQEVLAGQSVRVATVLHPSPASPLANRDWAGQARRQLRALGLCAT